MALSGWRLRTQNFHSWQCWYHALEAPASFKTSRAQDQQQCCRARGIIISTIIPRGAIMDIIIPPCKYCCGLKRLTIVNCHFQNSPLWLPHGRGLIWERPDLEQAQGQLLHMTWSSQCSISGRNTSGTFGQNYSYHAASVRSSTLFGCARVYRVEKKESWVKSAC